MSVSEKRVITVRCAKSPTAMIEALQQVPPEARLTEVEVLDDPGNYSAVIRENNVALYFEIEVRHEPVG